FAISGVVTTLVVLLVGKSLVKLFLKVSCRRGGGYQPRLKHMHIDISNLQSDNIYEFIPKYYIVLAGIVKRLSMRGVFNRRLFTLANAQRYPFASILEAMLESMPVVQ